MDLRLMVINRYSTFFKHEDWNLTIRWGIGKNMWHSNTSNTTFGLSWDQSLIEHTSFEIKFGLSLLKNCQQQNLLSKLYTWMLFSHTICWKHTTSQMIATNPDFLLSYTIDKSVAKMKRKKLESYFPGSRGRSFRPVGKWWCLENEWNALLPPNKSNGHWKNSLEFNQLGTCR